MRGRKIFVATALLIVAGSITHCASSAEEVPPSAPGAPPVMGEENNVKEKVQIT